VSGIGSVVSVVVSFNNQIFNVMYLYFAPGNIGHLKPESTSLNNIFILTQRKKRETQSLTEDNHLKINPWRSFVQPSASAAVKMSGKVSQEPGFGQSSDSKSF
jgi:hypothetical protein